MTAGDGGEEGCPVDLLARGITWGSGGNKWERPEVVNKRGKGEGKKEGVSHGASRNK